MGKDKKAKAPRIFSQQPSGGMSDLVVYYPGQNDTEYALAYHDAAMRLASTFKGRAKDDLLLLPFLTLFRQAFELQLKINIKELVTLRIEFLDGNAPELECERSVDKFKELGHNLRKILNKSVVHYGSLHLPEPFPDSVKDTIRGFHEADKGGTAFRYAGQLHGDEERINFPRFANQLNQEFILLESIPAYANDFFGK